MARRTDSGPNRNNLFSTRQIRERYGTLVLSFLTLLYRQTHTGQVFLQGKWIPDTDRSKYPFGRGLYHTQAGKVFPSGRGYTRHRLATTIRHRQTSVSLQKREEIPHSQSQTGLGLIQGEG
jgi:hypothetical protein